MASEKAGSEATSEARAKIFLEWAELGKDQEIRAALKERPELAMAKGENGDTALIVAVSCGWWNTIVELIPASDLRARGDGGHTALMRAAEQGYKEAVEALIPGSDPDAACDEGHTALGLAIIWGNLRCAAVLAPVSDPGLKWMAAGEMVDAEEAARRRGATELAEALARRKLALRESGELEAAAMAAPEARGRRPRV